MAWIRIRLDVRRPLKRKKKITKKDGSAFVVMCKYERLGEFCFVCGMLTHTECFCRKNLESRDETTVREWGSWLRAPPRRVAMQGKSKWLREEDDREWEARVGRDNCKEKFKEAVLQDKGIAEITDRKSRDMLNTLSGKQSINSYPQFQNNWVGLAQDRVGIIGLDQEELDGLNIEERKRRRSEKSMEEPIIPGMVLDNMITGDTHMGTALSNVDRVVSSANDLAKFAVQTSHPQ